MEQLLGVTPGVTPPMGRIGCWGHDFACSQTTKVIDCENHVVLFEKRGVCDPNHINKPNLSFPFTESCKIGLVSYVE